MYVDNKSLDFLLFSAIIVLGDPIHDINNNNKKSQVSKQ